MLLEPARASAARYIKLGEAGEWAERCIGEGTLRLGYYEAPHEAARRGDMDALREAYASRSRATASRYAGEVLQFYQEPIDTLWVTFSDDHLYWCHARPEVEYLGSDKTRHRYGSRLRWTVAGWLKTDIQGKPLLKRDLPGALTSTGRFQGTICRYAKLDRLLQVINCQPRPLFDAARAAYSQALDGLKPLVRELHPTDLELLIELIFAQSGYRRQSVTGETQKTIDIALELPITGETAFVQVKTSTRQAEFEDYVTELNGGPFDRMFYVYHTSPAPLVSSQENVQLIDLDDLCQHVLKAGLFDWVLRKAG